jgi:WD40 repeat protein
MHRVTLTALAVFVLASRLPPLGAQDVAPAVELGKPTVKLLDCRAFVAFHNSFMSPGGEWAVIYEGEHSGPHRLSLWDLKAGRLVRFLSAEKGKGTAEYDGDDDANFGAAIEQLGSQAFTFSPNGKYAAASVGETVRIWELASGKLLHEVAGSSFHSHTFRFADERRIVGKSNGGTVIETIDAATGEKRKLMGPVGFESYGGAVRGDTIVFVGAGEVFELSLKTGERKRLAAGSTASRLAPSRMWHSPDGSQLYIQHGELVQALDLATREYGNLFQLVAPREGHRIQALATDAAVLAISQPQRVELWDSAAGAVRTVIKCPSRLGNLGGISADGSKLLMAVEGQGAIVLDFTGPPPAGEVDVAQLIAQQAAVPGR